MYMGNGTAKKFLIPSGYDGSIVVLTLPSGKKIKMLAGDGGYKIENGAVIFSAAIPAGVIVSFDEPEESETLKNSSAYVVIYGDGTIKEVDEDPTLYLEQTQKLLTEAKALDNDVRQYAENTLTTLMRIGEKLTSDFEGRLFGYSTRAENAISEAAASVREDLRHEWERTLTEISSEAGTIREGIQIMEELKAEMRAITTDAAETTKEEIINRCSEIFEKITEVRELKAQTEEACKDAKYAAESAGREALLTMNTKAGEIIEMWRSLRLKMEADYEMLNTKINNRLEMLRSAEDVS